MILVTAVSGAFAAPALGSLAALGESLVVLAPAGTALALGATVRHVVGSPAAIDDVATAMQGAEAIVCLSPLPLAHLRNVCQAASYTAVERIVCLFAAGDLDASAGAALVDEEQPPAAAAAALAFACDLASQGAPLVPLITGMPYGPGVDPADSPAARRLADLAAGRPLAAAVSELRTCHALASDVGCGVALAVTRSAPGRRYILGGENPTYGVWLALAESVTGHRARLARGGALAAVFRRLGGGVDPAPVWPERDLALSSVRASSELGYRITPLAEGLESAFRAAGRGNRTRLADNV